MGFAQCWDRVKKATGKITQSELAEFLGIRSATVTDAKKRDVFPAEWALKIAQQYGLSTDWIVTGNGSMYRSLKQNGFSELAKEKSDDGLEDELENFQPEVDDYGSKEFEEQVLEAETDSTLPDKLKFVIKHGSDRQRLFIRGSIEEACEEILVAKKNKTNQK